MNQHEARIRDYLALHLDVIEPGLTLVEKEFKLANTIGASGSIDILAKDKLGHYVILEIKRSNQAARAALHELTKYVTLLQASKGVKPDRIRAILLSTEWHELAVPFSEYCKISAVSTAGVVIVASEDGTVADIKPFCPPTLEQPLQLERFHAIYLLPSAVQRDSALLALISAAKEIKVVDFSILRVDYGGKNSNVAYPFGAYFVFSAPTADRQTDDPNLPVADLMVEDELVEHSGEILRRLIDTVTMDRSEVEIGYPEKLATMASMGWQISVGHRGGRYAANVDLLSDDTLIKDAMRLEGGAADYFYGLASPRHRPSWCTFKADIARALLGCTFWSNEVQALLNRLEIDCTGATLAAKVFNPADLMVALGKLFAANDDRYVSQFELTVDNDGEVVLYIGVLAWRGTSIDPSATEFFSKLCGNLDRYMLERHLGSAFKHYDNACEILGLESIIFKICNPGSQFEAVQILRDQSANHFGSTNLSQLIEFVTQNREFGNSLVEALKASTIGLI